MVAGLFYIKNGYNCNMKDRSLCGIFMLLLMAVMMICNCSFHLTGPVESTAQVHSCDMSTSSDAMMEDCNECSSKSGKVLDVSVDLGDVSWVQYTLDFDLNTVTLMPDSGRFIVHPPPLDIIKMNC